MPVSPCDADTSADGTTCTKSHISPNLYHCDLINAMVPLTTALASQRYVKTLLRYCPDVSRHIMMKCLVIVWTHLGIVQMCTHTWAPINIV